MMKISELIGIQQGLLELAEKDTPIETALKIESNRQKVEAAIKPSSEVQKKLLEKYKDPNDDRKLLESKLKEFHAKNQELLDQKVDVELDLINISEIKKIVEGTIKGRTLALLKDVINYEEDKIEEEK